MIDPRDAERTARRLAARLVADQQETCALSLMRQRDGEPVNFDGGLVVVARGTAAAKILEYVLAISKGEPSFEPVPIEEGA